MIRGYENATRDLRGIFERFLPSTWRGLEEGRKDGHNAVLGAIANEMEKTELDALDSKSESWLETASGTYLDKWGSYMGVPRKKGWDDDKYRTYLKHEVTAKKGTIQGIIDGILWELDDPSLNIYIYEPWKNIFYLNRSKLNGDDHLQGMYYRYAVIDIHVPFDIPQDVLEEIIKKYKDAGVLVYYTYDSGLSKGANIYSIELTSIGDNTEAIFYFGAKTKHNKTVYLQERLASTEGRNSRLFYTNNSHTNGTKVLTGGVYATDAVNLISNSSFKLGKSGWTGWENPYIHDPNVEHYDGKDYTAVYFGQAKDTVKDLVHEGHIPVKPNTQYVLQIKTRSTIRNNPLTYLQEYDADGKVINDNPFIVNQLDATQYVTHVQKFTTRATAEYGVFRIRVFPGDEFMASEVMLTEGTIAPDHWYPTPEEGGDEDETAGNLNYAFSANRLSDVMPNPLDVSDIMAEATQAPQEVYRASSKKDTVIADFNAQGVSMFQNVFLEYFLKCISFHIEDSKLNYKFVEPPVANDKTANDTLYNGMVRLVGTNFNFVFKESENAGYLYSRISDVEKEIHGAQVRVINDAFASLKITVDEAGQIHIQYPEEDVTHQTDVFFYQLINMRDWFLREYPEIASASYNNARYVKFSTEGSPFGMHLKALTITTETGEDVSSFGKWVDTPIELETDALVPVDAPEISTGDWVLDLQTTYSLAGIKTIFSYPAPDATINIALSDDQIHWTNIYNGVSGEANNIVLGDYLAVEDKGLWLGNIIHDFYANYTLTLDEGNHLPNVQAYNFAKSTWDLIGTGTDLEVHIPYFGNYMDKMGLSLFRTYDSSAEGSKAQGLGTVFHVNRINYDLTVTRPTDETSIGMTSQLQVSSIDADMIHTITPFSISKNDGYMHGTYGGTKAALIMATIDGVNGAQVAIAPGNGSFKYYIADKLTKATQKVTITIFDAKGIKLHTASASVTA